MSTVEDLMGLGLPGPLASRLGNSITTTTGTGTSQAAGRVISNHVTNGAAESGQTAFTLPAGASLGAPFYYYNSGSATALIFPPVGGNIDTGSTDASYSVATHLGAVFIRLSSTAWMAIKSA